MVDNHVVIWDFSNVLCKVNYWKAWHKLGLFHILLYLLLDWKNPARIEKIAFKILRQVEPCPSDWQPVFTDMGVTAPYIFCLYLAGKKTGPESLKQVYAYIETLPKNTFTSSREQELVKRSLAIIFNPTLLAQSTYLIPEALALLKEVTQVSTCILFSNWDPVSFAQVMERHKDMFKLFKGRMQVSGMTHLLKPHPEAYKALISAYSLTPEHCIFIDDQRVNLKTAQEYGIHTILFRNGNYKTLRRKLIKMGAL